MMWLAKNGILSSLWIRHKCNSVNYLLWTAIFAEKTVKSINPSFSFWHGSTWMPYLYWLYTNLAEWIKTTKSQIVNMPIIDCCCLQSQFNLYVTHLSICFCLVQNWLDILDELNEPFVKKSGRVAMSIIQNPITANYSELVLFSI